MTNSPNPTNPQNVTGYSTNAQFPSPLVDGFSGVLNFTPPVDLTPHKTTPETRALLKADLEVSKVDFKGGHLVNEQATAKMEGLKDGYLNIRDIALNGAISTGTITDAHLETIKDFRINFDLKIATFTHPDTNKKMTIDLMGVPEAQQEEIDAFFKEADKVLNFTKHKRVHYSKNNKGNIVGQKSLQRETEDLKKLTKDHKQAAEEVLPKQLLKTKTPQERKFITQLLMFVQYMHQNMKKDLDGIITEREEQYRQALQAPTAQNPEDRRHIGIMRQELILLQQRRKELEELDVYALTMALANTPVGECTPEEFEEARRSLVETVKKDLKVPENVNAILDSNRLKAQKAIAYAEDIGGMFYTTRWDYTQYCEKNRLPVKQESIEDIFFRETLAFFADRNNYRGKGFVHSALFADFSQDLQGKVAVKIGASVRHLRENFPNRDASQFDMNMGAPNLPEKQKNAVDKRYKEIFKNTIKEFRKDLFPDDYIGPSTNPHQDLNNPVPNTNNNSTNPALGGDPDPDDDDDSTHLIRRRNNQTQ